MSSFSDMKDGRRLRRLDSRDRLYEAALSLLETCSFDDLSIDDICKEAGVGRATFFRVYKTKAGLLLEFNRRLAARAARRLETQDWKNAREALFVIGEEITNAWNEVGSETTSIAVDFISTVTVSELHKAHPELLKLVTSVMEHGIENGEIKATFPPDFLGSMALFYISAAAMLWFEDTDQDLSLLVQEAVESWLTGVCRDANDDVFVSPSRRKRK